MDFLVFVEKSKPTTLVWNRFLCVKLHLSRQSRSVKLRIRVFKVFFFYFILFGVCCTLSRLVFILSWNFLIYFMCEFLIETFYESENWQNQKWKEKNFCTKWTLHLKISNKKKENVESKFIYYFVVLIVNQTEGRRRRKEIVVFNFFFFFWF